VLLQPPLSATPRHLDMDRRRAYVIIGVDELELVVSARSGENSAESGAGICISGRKTLLSIH